MVVPLNTTLGYLAEKGKLSGPARDNMTKRALEIGAKYIFYWDDDVLLPSHAIYKMHNAMERDPTIGLITGVVCTREEPTEPMVYQRHGSGAWWDFSIDPDDPPEDIFSAGGGCILARVEALRKLEPPYWADVQADGKDVSKPGGSTWGHDIYFVSKVGRESGFRTCVMGSVLCGHWDIGKQKTYELPKDSPPYKKLASKPLIRKPLEVEETPIISHENVREQLKLSENERRLFIVSKENQKQSSVRSALMPFFEKVRVLSVDSQWLAIGEGLKNGWNKPVKRNTPHKD
jgi:hypothetical protein